MNASIRFHLAALCGLLAVSGCTPSRPAATPAVSTAPARAEVDRALTAAYAAFSDAYRQASPAAAAALYAEDAVYLETGMEPLKGRAAIEGAFRRFLSRFTAGAGPDIRFQVDDRRVRGDVVVDAGAFSFGAGPTATRYLLVWCHEPDGAWRICADSYHPQRRAAPPGGGR